MASLLELKDVYGTGVTVLTRLPTICQNEDMDQEKFHDRGYKMLFSHPRMVKELILSFVREEFVNDIDFSTLKRKRKIYAEIDIETMTGQEVRTMLEANLRRHEEELLEKGMEKGM